MTVSKLRILPRKNDVFVELRTLLQNDTIQQLRVTASPQRKRVSINDLSARGGNITSVFDESRLDWESVKYIDGSAVDFMVKVPTSLPKAFVVRFPGGRVHSASGWPLTASGEIVIDSVFAHERKAFRGFDLLPRPVRFRRLAGKTLNLTSAWSGVNYGHALKDALGRIAIIRGAGLNLHQFDTILVPAFKSQTLDFVLSHVGADPAQLVRAHHDLAVACDELTITSFPGLPRCYPGWLSWFFRGLVTPSRSDRRLWIPRRSGARADLNNDAATEMAAEFGFEPYSPGSTGNALQVFSEAEVVAGPHGAALANIVGCTPGTSVIEVLPQNHRYPHFASVAITSDMPYVAVRGDNPGNSHGSDTRTDLHQLRKAFEAMLG